MSFETNVQNLATRISTEVKSLRVLINGNQANNSGLTTTAKTNLVAAINELHALVLAGGGGGDVSPATETTAGIVELATTTEAVAGVDGARAVTPAGLKAATDALRTAILGTDVPAALDTLDELAAALGDDANFATTVTTALGNRQPLDATLTALSSLTTAADKLIYSTGVDTFALADLTAYARTLLATTNAAGARGVLDVYSKAELGNPEANFVATFEAGLV